MQHFNELDVVKVIRLATPTRDVGGTERVRRQPMVGDLGTVVAVRSPTSGLPGYYVESVNDEGSRCGSRSSRVMNLLPT